MRGVRNVPRRSCPERTEERTVHAGTERRIRTADRCGFGEGHGDAAHGDHGGQRHDEGVDAGLDDEQAVDDPDQAAGERCPTNAAGMGPMSPCSPRATTPDSARIEPTDRSSWPDRMTTVTPTAMMPSMDGALDDVLQRRHAAAVGHQQERHDEGDDHEDVDAVLGDEAHACRGFIGITSAASGRGRRRPR